MSNTREFDIWNSMIARCTNPNDHAYRFYGGRGITVCKRWLDSFEAFFEDMGPKPPGKSIDRFPDKNGPYMKSNTRWATATEQARNTRRNVTLTLNGESLLLCEWALRTKMTVGTIKHRLKKGWSVEKALTEPLLHHVDEAEKRLRLSRRLVTFRGVTRFVCEWADLVGIDADTILLRLKRGWSVERALTEPHRKRVVGQ